MRKLYICFVLLFFTIVARVYALEHSVELTHESRFYEGPGKYGNSNQEEISLIVKGEVSHSWDEDRKVVTFIPFGRISSPDDERSHADIREASFVGSWDRLELRAGISKVFWGVTESLHIVDVVNQTDLVENTDGEDKLGQPMINPTYVSDYGNFTYFFLPYFRERTFTGIEGRFRTPFVVETDRPIYTHEDEEKHIDHAFRYSHYIGDLEFGLSYFRGTDREPLFFFQGQSVRPLYVQSEQFAVDAQYIWGSWLFKGEFTRRDRDLKRAFVAAVGGFEYTFTNVHKGLDIGVLAEYLFDDRGTKGQAFFNNHTFLGSRLAFNDTLGTEILGGVIFNNEVGDFQSFRLEAARRINNSWKWELEINSLFNTRANQLIDFFEKDDYAQLSLTYYL